jgi:hypothetical protein
VYYLKTFNYNKKKGNTMIKLITTLVIATLTFSTHAKEETLDFAQHGFAIEQTVYKVPVSEGVTAEDVHMTI